jgi:hypothetical protein
MVMHNVIMDCMSCGWSGPYELKCPGCHPCKKCGKIVQTKREWNGDLTKELTIKQCGCRTWLA